MVYRRAHSGNGSTELTPDCTDGAHARSNVLRATTAKFSHSRWTTRLVARAIGLTRQRRRPQFVTPRETLRPAAPFLFIALGDWCATSKSDANAPGNSNRPSWRGRGDRATVRSRTQETAAGRGALAARPSSEKVQCRQRFHRTVNVCCWEISRSHASGLVLWPDPRPSTDAPAYEGETPLPSFRRFGQGRKQPRRRSCRPDSPAA